MGMLSEFVAAASNAAEKILESGNPQADFGGVDVKGIQTAELAGLHAAVLGGDPPEEAYEAQLLGDEDGPWLVPVADELTAALATLTSERELQVVDLWKTCFMAGDVPADDVLLTHLRAICGVCRDAIPRRDRTWLWISL